jgi:hypothetical protein
MGIDVRPGSPYTGQLVCSCPDGGGFQGMAPECCPTEPPTTAPPATDPPSDSGGSGGGPVGPQPQTTPDDEPEAETTVVVTETEEANWFDGEWIDGVKNKWLVAGVAALIVSLCCFCLMFLLLIVR